VYGKTKSVAMKFSMCGQRQVRSFSSRISLQLLQEEEQLQAIREQIKKDEEAKQNTGPQDRDFEGGFGGQEDLEDRYATTSGEH
jgi:hypothetical protein